MPTNVALVTGTTRTQFFVQSDFFRIKNIRSSPFGFRKALETIVFVEADIYASGKR